MKISIDSRSVRIMRDATRVQLHRLISDRNFWNSPARELPAAQRVRYYHHAREEIREIIQIIRDIKLIFARRDARANRTEIPKNYPHLRRILIKRRKAAKSAEA